MKTVMMAALLGASLMTSAQAEEATLSQTSTAGSLHDGALDMVVYAIPVPGNALEVTATFRDPATDDEPMRIVMPMQDGDTLSFGMPGYERSLYSVARSGQQISISVEVLPPRIATVATSLDEAKFLPQPVSAK